MPFFYKPFRDAIRKDLYRHGGLSGFRGFIKGWYKPGFRYTFVYRMLNFHDKTSVFSIILKYFKRRYMFKYGYQIDIKADIGEGFYLSDHCGPVIIGPVKIGRNCNVNHNVTIGRAYKKGILGRPKIGDYVWIGTGAVIVGGIRIGSNVLIAPNSFVNIDVPDNSIVIGNPAKVISKENPTRYYINFVTGDRTAHPADLPN